MKKNFINAMVFGALVAVPSATFVACEDYDDDIASLQGQIDANASQLDDVVVAKIANAEKEIEALKAMNAKLEEAYKAADSEVQKTIMASAAELVEDAKAELSAKVDAANAVIAEQGKSLNALLEANSKLETAVNTAAANASKALELAQQAMKAAEANKEEIGKLTEIVEGLSGIEKSLKEEFQSLLDEEVQKLAGQMNEQNAALKGQMTAMEEKIAELQKELENGGSNAEVEANKKQIEALKALVEELQTVVDGNKTALEAEIARQVEMLNAAVAESSAADKAYTDKAVAALNEKYAEAAKKFETALADVEKMNAAVAEMKAALQKSVDELKGADEEQKKALKAQNETIAANYKALVDKIEASAKAADAAVKASASELEKKFKEEVGSLKAELEGKIGDLKTALTKDIDNVEKALEAAAKTNTAKFESIDKQMKEILEDLKKKADASTVESVKKELNDQIAEIKNLLNGKDKNSINNRLKALEAAQVLQDKTNKKLEGEIAKVQNLVNCLYDNFKNLITGIIYQGNEVDIRYSQVTHTNYTDEKGKKFVVFPAEGNPNGRVQVEENKWLVETDCGLVFATINPTNIDFSTKGNKDMIELWDSKGNGVPEFKLTDINKSTHLIDADTRGAKPTGLYEVKMECAKTDGVFDKVPDAFTQNPKKKYAVRVSYNQTTNKDKNGKDTIVTEEKVVTSRYEMQINAKRLHANDAVGHKAFEILVDGSNSRTIVSGLQATLSIHVEGLTRNRRENPMQGYFYKSYLKVAAIDGDSKHPLMKEVQAGTWTNTVLSGEILDQQVAVNASLKNHTVTFEWQVLNYDGSIATVRKDVTFTDPLFADAHIDVAHVPASNEEQKVDVTKLVGGNFQDKPSVVTAAWNGASFMAPQNKEAWAKQFSSLVCTSADNRSMTLHFFKANRNDKGEFTGWEPITPGTEANNKLIEKVELWYTPSTIENTAKTQESKYNVNCDWQMQDANGHPVANIKVALRIEKPQHLNMWTDGSISRRVQASFGVMDVEAGNGTLSKNNTTIAWAKSTDDKQHATYDLSASFADLENNQVRDALKRGYAGYQNSNHSRYVFSYDKEGHKEYADKYGLELNNSAYEVSVKNNAVVGFGQVWGNTDVNMSYNTPVAASKGVGFNIKEDIHYYNLAFLNQTVDNGFNLCFLSPVNYGVAKLEQNRNVAKIATPTAPEGAKINVGEIFRLNDYSTTKNDDFIELGTTVKDGKNTIVRKRSELVKNVSVVLRKTSDNNWSKISNFSGNVDSVTGEFSVKVTAENVTSDATIKAYLVVEDYFGFKTVCPFEFTLNPSDIDTNEK